MNQNFQIAVLVFYSLYYFDHLKCHKDTKFQWKNSFAIWSNSPLDIIVK